MKFDVDIMVVGVVMVSIETQWTNGDWRVDDLQDSLPEGWAKANRNH